MMRETHTNFLAISIAALLAAGCTRKHDNHAGSGDQPRTESETTSKEQPGVLIPSGNLPTPNPSTGEIAYLGGIITTRVIGDRLYIPVEGTFSEASFNSVMEAASAQNLSAAERKALLSQEVGLTLTAIGKSVTVAQPTIVSEVGYFSALVPLEQYSQLSGVTGLSHRVLMSPVMAFARDPSTTGFVPASGVALGLHADKGTDARSTTDGFSGLARIGVSEFLAATKAELGQDVDGAQVNVGVTDTGITLNHPSFFDANGVTRIQYMKDFTGEGQIYFASNSTFAAREPLATELPKNVDAAEAIVISAQYLLPPAGRALPDPDRYSEVKEQIFQVSPELKKTLLTPNTGARLGVFSEGSFDSPDGREVVDLNHNGKHDDLLWAILLPDSDHTKSRIFFDITGRGDLRKSPALTNWNTSHTTMTAFSEKFGFDVKSIKLNGGRGVVIETTVAAIVGYDPGNHGSHVSGIIGGRKTIANDADGTKARGVAPNTKLLVNRVCANNGGCGATEAMIDLALAGAEVVNMSLGGLSPFNDGYGVQETIVNRLTQLKNTLFVISAGNSGPGRQTIGSPSVARLSLSVAATASRKMIERQYQFPGLGSSKPSALAEKEDDDDFVLFFSSRGPTAAGGFKPSISAPGTELSAVQLNSAAGQRAGLDVYWGTSMAAPTATGAVALLIDAAKRYNELHPESKLPLDAVTLHRVISESARPFDVDSFVVKNQQRSLGQYTWIDQGNGMIDLLAAWKALKAERDGKLPSAVQIDLGGGKFQSVDLDYEIRVLRVSPNGNDYTGSDLAPVDTNGGVEAKFGRGIYLDINGTDSLIGVQVARRLPLSAARREDAGELSRQLVTTADRFVLETTMYGSAVEWLKAGTLDKLDCQGSPTTDLTVIGAGPIDNSESKDPTQRSVALAASSLQVCVDRKLINALLPGDHGALIKAYRVLNGRKEKFPSFVVPVYIAVPHGTLAGKAGYKIEGSVRGFGIDRHYVQIPKGTSLVKVSIEVPVAKLEGTVVSGCSGVELMALEGGNTLKAPELSPRDKARIANCERSGAVSDKRILSYSRFNPKAGIWDLHVFGQSSYAQSPYTLTVEFAKVEASIPDISGKPEKLTGSLDFTVLDASIKVVPSEAKSVFGLTSLIQDRDPSITEEENLKVPTVEGIVPRSFDETVATVTFATGGLAGSDLDLKVEECDDIAMITCKSAGESSGATDVESVTIKPLKGKFYVPVVNGFMVVDKTAKFHFVETRTLAKPEVGTVKVTSLSEDKFKIDYSFDVIASVILKSELFVSGKWAAGGDLTLKSDEGAGLIRLPVKITP